MRIRDKATDFLMIIGLTISFLVVIYGIGIYNTAISSTSRSEKTSFTNEYNFKISSLSRDDNDEQESESSFDVVYKILSVLDMDTGNISIPWGSIAGQALLPFDVNMYLDMHETPKAELKWGRYPTNDDFNQNAPVIVVDTVIIDYATKKGEKYYLDVYGESYEIIGVLDDIYKTSNSGYIVMFYECTVGRTRDVFHTGLFNGLNTLGREVKYESDKNITEQYNEIRERAKMNNIYISPFNVREEEIDWFTLLIIDLKFLFSTALFLLCVVNCCSISFLWIKHRMNEYSVRKAFGYSTTQLLIHVLKEFVPIALASAVLTMIIHFINIAIFENQSLHVDNPLPLVITMLFSVAFSMLIPLRIASRVKPATGIKEL